MESIERSEKPERELKYDEKGAVMLTSSVEEILKENSAYQYLCHVYEVREWLKKLGKDQFEIPEDSIINFENSLRNGVALALLGNLVYNDIFPKSAIFDIDLNVYHKKGLVFRHIDNINIFYRIMKYSELPTIFFPVTTDIYDRKNMPKLIYSIHALGMLLYRKGLVKYKIGDEFGKIKFDKEEISIIQKEFDSLNISMPQFGKINGILAKNMKKDEVKKFACIAKINSAIDEMNSDDLVTNLIDPLSGLENVEEDLKDGYLTLLSVAKKKKIENNTKILDGTSEEDLDYYIKNLTSEEIQKTIENGNMNNILHLIDIAIVKEKYQEILSLLREPILGINSTLFVDHDKLYLEKLKEFRNKNESQISSKDIGNYILDRDQILEAILDANSDIEREIHFMQALGRLNKTIIENDKNRLYDDMTNEELKLENIKQENVELYLNNLNNFYNLQKRQIDVIEVQKIINETNGVLDTERKIKDIIMNIYKLSRKNKINEINELLSSNLLNIKFNDENIAIYCKFFKDCEFESERNIDEISKIEKIIQKADLMTDDAKQLAILTINLAENPQNREYCKSYIESDLTGLKNEIIEQNYKLYSEFLTRKLSNSKLKEEKIIAKQEKDKDLDSNKSMDYLSENNNNICNDKSFFKCISKEGNSFIYDENLEKVIWNYDNYNKYKDIKQTNNLRPKINEVASIIRKANEFQKISSQEIRITKIQNLIKMLLLYVKSHKRFNKIIKKDKEIIKIQDFFRNLVGRNDFYNIMNGQIVKFPVIIKFANILIPSDFDLQKMMELSQLKSEVREMIIANNEKENAVKDLELLCTLLVQSKFGEGIKDDLIPAAVTSGYLRQERVETLKFYGKLLFCMNMYDKYFAKLIYLLDKEDMTEISSTIIPIFNYISTPREEMRMLKCIIRSIDIYIEDKDTINHLMQGSAAPFKLSIECMNYLKKDNFSAFLECYRKPINILIVASSENTFSIDPIQIYVDLKKSEAVLDLTVEKVLSEKDVYETLQNNIKSIIEFTSLFITTLSNSYKYIPYIYRAIVKSINENNKLQDNKTKMAIISNFLLNRLMSQIITLPEQFNLTNKKPEEINEKQRKLMTQVSNILVAIGMDNRFEGKHMTKLNEFVANKQKEWIKIVNEVSNIRNIFENYQVPKKSEFFKEPESITLRIQKILTLHRYILKYKDKLIVKEDDPLEEIIKESDEPKIENFLRDPNVDEVTKKEMSRKLVTIELVRQVKKDSKKFESPKHKMKILKTLFCQLLFSIDNQTFSPSKIQEVLYHKWSNKEKEKHNENTKILKGLSDSRYSNDDLSFSLKNLDEIQKKCLELIDSLKESKMISEEDDYQELNNEIANDIRSEHSRKIEIRHEISLLTVSKSKLSETSQHLDKKIPYLNSYINSLKSSLSRSKKNRKSYIFGSGNNKSKRRGKTFSVEKLIKKDIIVKFSQPDVKSPKSVQVRFLETNDGNFKVSLVVIGNEIDETSISSSDVILMTYNKKETVELFKGIIFDTKKLYQLLLGIK